MHILRHRHIRLRLSDIMKTVIVWLSVCISAFTSYSSSADARGLYSIEDVDFELNLEVSKKNPYAGEAIEITWFLIGNTTDIRAFEGFDLRMSYGKDSSDADIYRASISGREGIQRVRVGKEVKFKIPIGHVVVVGKKKGSISINVSDGIVGVIVPEYVSDPFRGNIRINRVEKCNIKGKSSSVNCKSLPGKAPKDFSGAVGNFKIKGKNLFPEMDVNENGFLEITVEGPGWIPEQAIMEIRSCFHAPVKLKSIEEDRKNLYVNQSLYSQLSFVVEYIIEEEGTYSVAPFRFVYFDPETKTYRTAEFGPVAVGAGETTLPSKPLKAMPV